MKKIDRQVRVAIGTQNRAKTEGVERAFEKVFLGVEAVGFAAESGIADQPATDEESIKGATNRAKSAMAQLATADFGVGLEGNVVTISGHMFLHGWAAVIDQQGRTGLGHSSGLELPEWMKDEIDGGAELGPLMQKLLADDGNDVRHSLGTIGVLTGGLETRVKEFDDATTLALAKFISPDLYKPR